jgi:hypothetical protein
MARAQPPRFAATDSTRGRWRQQKRSSQIIAAAVGVVAIGVLWTRHDPALWVGVGVIALAIFGLSFGYTASRRSTRRLPAGVLWAGMTSTKLVDLQNAGLDATIRLKSKGRFRFWTQGVGGLSFHLELTSAGIRLRVSWMSWLSGASGVVLIPWSDIQDFEVGDYPGVINRGLGGGYSVALESGHTIDGSFLGPRETLLAELEKAPINH